MYPGCPSRLHQLGSGSRPISSCSKPTGSDYETARASPPREGSALLQGRCRVWPLWRAYEGPLRRSDAARWTLGMFAIAHTAPRGTALPNDRMTWPVDEVIGDLIAAEMTPHAVELALEIRKKSKPAMTRPIGSGGVPSNALKIDAELAQHVSSCMLVDPGNRLVADTLERENGTTSCASWPAHRKKERAPCARTASRWTTQSGSG